MTDIEMVDGALTYGDLLVEVARQNGIVPLLEAAMLRVEPNTELEASLRFTLRLAYLAPFHDRGVQDPAA